MKMILALFILFVVGCTSSTTSTGSMTPIQAAGCDIETAILGGAAGAIAQGLSCSNQAAVQASLTTALGNANLCATPIPPTPPATTPTATAAKMADSTWKTIGDVPGTALHPSTQMKSAAAMKQFGIVGNIACPIAISTVMGFLSNSVPTAWSCSTSATAAALSSALVSACEAAVPI